MKVKNTSMDLKFIENTQGIEGIQMIEYYTGSGKTRIKCKTTGGLIIFQTYEKCTIEVAGLSSGYEDDTYFEISTESSVAEHEQCKYYVPIDEAPIIIKYVVQSDTAPATSWNVNIGGLRYFCVQEIECDTVYPIQSAILNHVSRYPSK